MIRIFILLLFFAQFSYSADRVLWLHPDFRENVDVGNDGNRNVLFKHLANSWFFTPGRNATSDILYYNPSRIAVDGRWVDTSPLTIDIDLIVDDYLVDIQTALIFLDAPLRSNEIPSTKHKKLLNVILGQDLPTKYLRWNNANSYITREDEIFEPDSSSPLGASDRILTYVDYDEDGKIDPYECFLQGESGEIMAIYDSDYNVPIDLDSEPFEDPNSSRYFSFSHLFNQDDVYDIMNYLLGIGYKKKLTDRRILPQDQTHMYGVKNPVHNYHESTHFYQLEGMDCNWYFTDYDPYVYLNPRLIVTRFESDDPNIPSLGVQEVHEVVYDEKMFRPSAGVIFLYGGKESVLPPDIGNKELYLGPPPLPPYRNISGEGDSGEGDSGGGDSGGSVNINLSGVESRLDAANQHLENINETLNSDYSERTSEDIDYQAENSVDTHLTDSRVNSIKSLINPFSSLKEFNTVTPPVYNLDISNSVIDYQVNLDFSNLPIGNEGMQIIFGLLRSIFSVFFTYIFTKKTISLFAET